MINSLPMMNASPSMLQLAVFLLLNLVIGLFFLRKRRLSLKRNARRGLEQHFPMSCFSQVNHPVLEKYYEEVNPLTEAEIYVIYGRKHEAQKVLDSGVREGLISTEQVIRFWSEQGHSRLA